VIDGLEPTISSDGLEPTTASADSAEFAPAEPVVPAPPAVVAERFPDAVDLLMRFAQLLAGPGTVRGLLGPREVPRIWDRHLLNCVALTELLPAGIRVVDIGSGAGLPGLAIACVRPDLSVDLVESLLRRTEFLTEAVAELGLAARVRVIRGRAEDAAVAAQAGSAPVVTARAVAPLDRLVRWAFPLLQPGGSLLAVKGESAATELNTYRSMLRRSRAELAGVMECGVGLVDPPTRVVKWVRR
jgi:16S rRNA (guanine527-N7)-methyltransferase